MDIRPRKWQRLQQRILLRVTPTRWLVPYLRRESLGSFFVLFFVRWLFVAIWVIPMFLLALSIFLLLLPLWLLWFVSAWLLSKISTAWSAPKKNFYHMPAEIAGDGMAKLSGFVLLPELWLDRQL